MLILAHTLAACRQEHDQVQSVAFLPIKLIDGYGPFQPGFGLISNSGKDSPVWGKTYHVMKGIPTYWSQAQICQIWLNSHQFAYQNFLAGNISKVDYQGLQKGWTWTPDTTKLSKVPIKCYLYVVKGFNENTGKWAVLVDTNNNLDFSDETAVYPEKMNSKDPYSYTQALTVQYELYQKGQIYKRQLPMVLKTYGSELFYNFPQHASVLLKDGDKEYKLLVSSGFTRPDYEVTNLVNLTTSFLSNKVDPKEEIQIDDIIEINHVRYVNKGIDVFNNWLELEPVNSLHKPYSLQVGYPIRPFKAKAFNSEQVVDLSQYRGKYVYLDFWAPWCKACVEDMPALKKVYQETDRKRVDFVGIVKDSPKGLAKFLKKQPLDWTQIISDSANNLVEVYHISGLPTSVLIDPNGIVVGRDLRPNELEAVLRKNNR